MSLATQILQVVSKRTEPLWNLRRLNFGIDHTSPLPVHLVSRTTVEDVVIPHKLARLENRQLPGGDDLGWRLLGERAGHDADDITRAFNRLERSSLDNETRIKELSLDFVDWGELLEGFQQGFRCLVESVLSNEEDAIRMWVNTVTPRLGQLLCDFRIGHEAAGVVPELVLTADSVKATVIGARVEQGTASTPGDLFGVVSPEEVSDQFWRGVRGPEYEPYDWRKVPSRIVVDVLIRSLECSRLRDKNEPGWVIGVENSLDGSLCRPDLQITRNVLTFESNLPCKGRAAWRNEERTAWNWRIRNWNGVLR